MGQKWATLEIHVSFLRRKGQYAHFAGEARVAGPTQGGHLPIAISSFVEIPGESTYLSKDVSTKMRAPKFPAHTALCSGPSIPGKFARILDRPVFFTGGAT